MMKTSVLRQARLGRVALGAASRVRIVSRQSPSTVSALLSAPRVLTTQYRALSITLPRCYSSEASAPESRSQPANVTKFADLSSLNVHPTLVMSITQGMRYEDMTEVQSATISAALDGKDLVAQAKTGTGKTLAFLVPVIQRILNQDPSLAHRSASFRASADDIRAIIVSPTRELAEQIGEEAKKLTRGTGVVIQTAVGGTQKRAMLMETRRRGCHVLVATPGRLHDLLSDPDSGIAAPNLKALVLDEADRMLDTGFDAELREILKYLPDRAAVPRQTLLFSATMPSNVVGLARNYIDPRNFDFVQTIKADEVQTHDRVPQLIAPCKTAANLLPALLELFEKEIAKVKNGESSIPFKPIVFLPTTASVVLVSALLKRLRRDDRSLPDVIDIHSKLSQHQRTRAAEDFKHSESAILVSSDVTARGMDFPGVSHVIQVYLPGDRDQYIHRLGRTGRAGKEGTGWLLVCDSEVSAARRRLPGLPIKRSTDLAAATVDATRPVEELPGHFQKIRSAAEKLPEYVLHEAYRSLLGGAMKGLNPQSVVDEANAMAQYCWGLDQMPVVARGVKMNLGNVEGLRVGNVPASLGHGRGVGHRGDFGGNDPFAEKFGGFEDRRGGNGGYGGRGGFRGRGGGGGFGGRGGGGGFGGRGGGRDFGGRGGNRGGSGGRDDFGGPSASF